jgi:hypothetical protein
MNKLINSNTKSYFAWLTSVDHEPLLLGASGMSRPATMEHLEGVNYGFYGARLDTVQRMQRLYNTKDNTWGFKDAMLLTLAYAVMMGESGGYLKAYHHNVERDVAGNIVRHDVDGKECMKVKSTDLGFIQKNTPHSPARLVEMTEEASLAFVDELFVANPALCNGYESCKIAWNLYKSRGNFSAWYAYINGGYKRSLPLACVAVGKFAANKYLNDPEYVTKRGD